VKVVMTLMVRDEADIVGAMLEHHRREGIDHVVVTDNGSVDETAEILARFAAEGFATVWFDPVHRKQQFATVTRMARYAATELGADWVLNADADEFWVATAPGSRVRDALTSLESVGPYARVRVVNLTGAPARSGTGLQRLRYRDERSTAELRAAGIPFHPTADALHRGNSEVEVAQGNHFVSAPGWPDSVPVTDSLEVLHLPWRSWRQYEHKVRVSGEAYLANPDLSPSPNHHGMQDFRRWQEGRLEYTYVAKHPLPVEIDALIASGSLVEDTRLAMLDTDGVPGRQVDELYESAASSALADIGRKFAAVENSASERVQEIQKWHDLAVMQRDEAQADLARVTADRDVLADQERRRLDWFPRRAARRLRLRVDRPERPDGTFR
jgi:hypothetical protein